MYLKQSIRNEIVNSITKKFHVKEIILFGSYAYGSPNENSDLDLLIILNREGFISNWLDRINLKTDIRKTLLNLNKIFPIELLLYTKDEWEKLSKSGSCFFDEINVKGVKLI